MTCPSSWTSTAVSGTLQLQIDDSHARYPLRIDPFIQQGRKLVPSDENGEAWFGYSVAMSSDGNTALVGGWADTSLGGEGRKGAAWVFTRSAATWSEQAKIQPTDEIEGADFGESVALSSDGNTALIGGPGDHTGRGSAWVYARSGSVWTEQRKLSELVPESELRHFAQSVALSADGNTALVGAEDRAWYFKRSGTSWGITRFPTLTPKEEGKGGNFGVRVALSSDGTTALIGDSGEENSNGPNAGSAWVFLYTCNLECSYSQQAKLVPTGESGAGFFGAGVSLSSDGNTALIGASADNHDIGAAWVFTRSGSTWTQQGEKLTGSGEIGAGGFGSGVSLVSDGETALIGAGGDNSGVGAAWVFTRSGETWTQQGEKLTGGEESGNASFGFSVALSGDGNTALIGGIGDNGFVGAAWAFAQCTALQVERRTLSAATRSIAYSTQLAACGGIAPYKWKKVGKLPKGLKLSRGGVLAGTPSKKLAAGSYPIGVRVTDAARPKDSAATTLTLQIS